MGTSNRYWLIIDHAFPSPAELRSSLAALPKDELLAFAAYVFQAAHDVREPWRGPFGLSEDSTEDLTAFVVSLGEAYWRELVAADDAALGAAQALLNDVRDPQHPRRWETPTGTENLYFAAMEVYEQRYGEDTFLDALDTHLVRNSIAD